MRIRSQGLIIACVLLLLAAMVQPALGTNLNMGDMDANLSSAVSNNTSVTFDNRYSVYSGLPYGQQNPPNIWQIVYDNSVQVQMDYRMRDDSNVSGKSQEIKMDVWSWNPQTYSWTWLGSQGSTQGSKGWGKYNATGTKSMYLNWGSSTKVALHRVQGYAKSGDKSTTASREFWIVASPTATGTGQQDAPRWICDRYTRSMFYNQIANNLQQIQNDADSTATQDGLNTVIRYGKGFVMTSQSEFVISSGLDAISILNTAWKTSVAAGEILDGASVMFQGFNWVQNAISLLTTGTRDAIANAQTPLMTQQAAAAAFPGLKGSLDTVANACRDDASACQNMVYATGTMQTATWKTKLDAEKTAIDSAIASVGSARSSLVTWKNGYSSYGNLPLIGTNTTANAQYVYDNLNSYLNYIEYQLKSDKAIIDKASYY